MSIKPEVIDKYGVTYYAGVDTAGLDSILEVQATGELTV